MNRIGFLVSVIALLAFGCERKQASPPASAPSLPASAPSVSEEKETIAFYLLADVRMTGPQAKKQNLEDLVLADKLLFTEGDILFYDQKSCQLFLKLGTVKRIVKAIGLQRPRNSSLIPLIAMVRGKRRFLCALSAEEPTLSKFQNRRFRRQEPDMKKDMAGVGAVTLLSPWGSPDGKDPRDDAVFLKALNEARKLDESNLAKPRMSRDEVITAAKKMSIQYQQGAYKTQPKPVPDRWKIASVTFCREAVVTSPSINIIGLVGPSTSYCVWIIRFDVSADPEFRKAHRRPIACLVNDATGNVRTIYPPLYIKSLAVPKTDLVISIPVASEDEVRKVARNKLEVITRIRFMESAECQLITEQKTAWNPLVRFWFCEGTNAKGENRQIILTDRIPHYRGPEIWFKGDLFRLRRIVPFKAKNK